MERRKMCIRSAKEPAEITVTIQTKEGREELEDAMMMEIIGAIQKRNRRSHRTGGGRMAYRVELV